MCIVEKKTTNKYSKKSVYFDYFGVKSITLSGLGVEDPE